jgi:hypothetical protein
MRQLAAPPRRKRRFKIHRGAAYLHWASLQNGKKPDHCPSMG